MDRKNSFFFLFKYKSILAGSGFKLSPGPVLRIRGREIRRLICFTLNPDPGEAGSQITDPRSG